MKFIMKSHEEYSEDAKKIEYFCHKNEYFGDELTKIPLSKMLKTTLERELLTAEVLLYIIKNQGAGINQLQNNVVFPLLEQNFDTTSVELFFLSLKSLIEDLFIISRGYENMNANLCQEFIAGLYLFCENSIQNDQTIN